MSHVYIRPELLCAWSGQSLLVADVRGNCGVAQPFSGFYFREARHLSTLRLLINSDEPWLCEAAEEDPATLRFNYIYPELTSFGGGGSGVSTSENSTDANGLPHRSLEITVTYRVGIALLRVELAVTNHGRETATPIIEWKLGADFADIMEAPAARREQTAAVRVEPGSHELRFHYDHPELPYQTRVAADGPGEWRTTQNSIASELLLESQATALVALHVQPLDYRDMLLPADVEARERHRREWRRGLTQVATPGNPLAERIVAANVRDYASLPLLHGREDEWLAMQAGIPQYPALFGRDALTAGWQAAFLDSGSALEASLTRLGRMQSDHFDDWHDAQPGRLPHEVRLGPLSRLGGNPLDGYYGDYAGPLMFAISLANLYAWTGDKRVVERHWDTARRALDWARDYGDLDGDGYIEYQTRSAEGLAHQGWKDSGDAVVYDDGTPVPRPTATCELQGYWFAAQQLMAVLSWVMNLPHDASAHWSAATQLKERFNRDWWMEDEGCVAFAMDPDKRLVRSATSNVGHCIASGIVSDEHLPRAVGRLFAPDMFSGWGIRTLSASHAAYDPVSYHRGSVWAVENATIAFGLRRFGFDARALDLAQALFDLAELYPGYRIPETIGGHARGARPSPGAYPRANAVQLWNASGIALLVHTILGLQPVAPLNLLVVDPVLPSWLPEVVLRDLRLGGATATIRFWRDDSGASHVEVVHKRGALHLLRQPPPESLGAGIKDRFGAIADQILHH